MWHRKGRFLTLFGQNRTGRVHFWTPNFKSGPLRGVHHLLITHSWSLVQNSKWISDTVQGWSKKGQRWFLGVLFDPVLITFCSLPHDPSFGTGSNLTTSDYWCKRVKKGSSGVADPDFGTPDPGSRDPGSRISGWHVIFDMSPNFTKCQKMTFLVIFWHFWKVGFLAFLAIFCVLCKTGHFLIMNHVTFFGINAKKQKNDKNDHFDTFLRPLKKWHFWRFLPFLQNGHFLIRLFRGHFLAKMPKSRNGHFWRVQKRDHDTGSTLCDVIFAHLAN